MGLRRELLFEELTGRVIGQYYDVYNTLGSGLLEPSYQQAMAIALTDAGLHCEREVPIQATFRGRTIGQYRIDLVVERSLIIECKTSDSLSPNYHTQIRNYLRVSGLKARPDPAVRLKTRHPTRNLRIRTDAKKKKMTIPPVASDI